MTADGPDDGQGADEREMRRPDEGPRAGRRERPGQRCEVDGREVRYAEYGPSSGRPVVFLHGTPGSRLLGEVLAGAAEATDVRLVAPDRPGMGRSDPNPGRTLQGWAADLEGLLDDLGLDEVGVVAFSGGGPHALACGVAVPDRLTEIALLAGTAPPSAPRGGLEASDRAIGVAARRAPWLLRGVFRSGAWLAERGSPASVTGFYSDRPVGEGEDAIDPTVARIVYEDFLEAFRQGARGVVRESELLAEPWGFDPAAVDVPVTAWYGAGDANVPPEHGWYLADRLPGVECSVVDGADHLAVLTRCGIRALRAVA